MFKDKFKPDSISTEVEKIMDESLQDDLLKMEQKTNPNAEILSVEAEGNTIEEINKSSLRKYIKMERLAAKNAKNKMCKEGRSFKNKLIEKFKNNELTNEEVENLDEKHMTSAEKAKETSLKAKYDPSGMKSKMMAQYGKEKGKAIYFATIRKKAMKEDHEELDEKLDYSEKSTDMLKGRVKGGKKDDVGPGADGKSTKVKYTFEGKAPETDSVPFVQNENPSSNPVRPIDRIKGIVKNAHAKIRNEVSGKSGCKSE